MVRLKTSDASVLARVAQYDKLPLMRKDELLNTLKGDAHEIGLVLTGRKNAENASRDVKEAAERITRWAQHNRARPRFKHVTSER